MNYFPFTNYPFAPFQKIGFDTEIIMYYYNPYCSTVCETEKLLAAELCIINSIVDKDKTFILVPASK